MERKTTIPAHPHLLKLHDDARQNAERVSALFSSLTDEQLTWKPEPKKWSIAECIEHLLITDGLYLPGLTEAIERGPRSGLLGNADYRPRLFQGWFIGASGEKGRMKVKTFPSFDPARRGRGGEANAGARFLEQQEKLRALMRQADGLDLNNVRFTSPLSRLMRFTLGEAFTMLISHQKRHIAQAERVRGMMNSE